MVQYLEVKKQHPDKLVLFRMGDFYETFFDDARKASSILGITLTARDARSENPIPLAGIPFHSLGEYLPKFIRAGLKVAICDQVEDPKQSKGLVKREVVRVVTQGTLTEDSLLEANRSNFLMAVDESKGLIHLAYLDFSTGEICVRHVDQKRSLDLISSLRPSELIISKTFERHPLASEIRSRLDLPTTALDAWNFSLDFGQRQIKSIYKIDNLEGLGLSLDSAHLKTLGALLKYLEDTQFSRQFHLQKIRTIAEDLHMILDRHTCRNLEIFQNQIDGSAKGSLYGCMNHTSTPMGARLLGNWMAQPLLDEKNLKWRFDMVEAFIALDQRNDFLKILKDMRDLERPLGRIRCGRYSARDIKSIELSLKMIPSLNALLKPDPLLTKSRMPEEVDLCQKIGDILKDELPVSLREGGMIHAGQNSELDELRQISQGGLDFLQDLEKRLKEEHELPSLKVRKNKIFGYYIEVPKGQSAKVPAYFVRKQTLVNAERYIIDELKIYEDKIFGAQDKIFEIEFKMIELLCEDLLKHQEAILEVASTLAKLDVLSCFANQAIEQTYVRPEISQEPTLKLKSSRHPVVEKLMSVGEFCANDLSLDGKKTQILLLTGPNMSGKSTFIRQIGLIQIMCQMGSFVPASHAKMSLADRVFTRVGAGDDLSSGRSTFMVEMNETANILHNATPKSLVILDEVGRGTSTLDGLSLAWAITEELHNNSSLRPMSLFATHYHELTELAKSCPRIANFRVDVEESESQITFLHKIKEGGTDKSYGVHVAKLAGLPEKIIRRARELLIHFEGDHQENLQDIPAQSFEALPLFSLPDESGLLRDKLQEINPDDITPLQALIFLKELKDLLRS